MTKIEWTEKTWNPIVGCSVVSPGCTNCYAMKMAGRIEKMGGAPQYDGTTKQTRAGAVFTGKVALAEKALLEPLKRKKPTMYFVNSMGDLFHENVPDDWIDQVFAVMALCPQHTFQVLTKRSGRMKDYCAVKRWRVLPRLQDVVAKHGGIFLKRAKQQSADLAKKDTILNWPLPNVWLGVSAEDQLRADERIPDLLDTPAAIRFVSAEPLLGPIEFEAIMRDDKGFYALSGIRSDGLGPSGFSKGPSLDWVIAGGESGHKARPMHPAWVRSIRDQCATADVPFFFKQWGQYADHTELHSNCQACKAPADLIIDQNGHVQGGGAKGYGGFVDEGWKENGQAWMCKTGKKVAGRDLDGKEHNGMPG